MPVEPTVAPASSADGAMTSHLAGTLTVAHFDGTDHLHAMTLLATARYPDFGSYPGVSIGTAAFGFASLLMLSDRLQIQATIRGWIAVGCGLLMFIWFGALMPLMFGPGAYSVHAVVASYIAASFGLIYGIDAFRSGGWHRRGLGILMAAASGFWIILSGYHHLRTIWVARQPTA